MSERHEERWSEVWHAVVRDPAADTEPAGQSHRMGIGAKRAPATATITLGVDAHDTTTIDLTGELCTMTVNRVRQLIEEVADASPASVAIDMSAVTFIDARGLSLLLITQHRLAERGLGCRMVSPSEAVRRLFTLVGLKD